MTTLTPEQNRRSLLTVQEACSELRISRWMFYRLVQRRQLETLRIGSRRLITPTALARFIAAAADEERDQ